MDNTELSIIPERQNPRRHPRLKNMNANPATSSLHVVPALLKSPDDLLNQREVASWFGVDVSWVKNHCTRTEPILPFIQLGGGRYATRRFRREDIEEFLALHTIKPRKIKPRKVV